MPCQSGVDSNPAKSAPGVSADAVTGVVWRPHSVSGLPNLADPPGTYTDIPPMSVPPSLVKLPGSCMWPSMPPMTPTWSTDLWKRPLSVKVSLELSEPPISPPKLAGSCVELEMPPTWSTDLWKRPLCEILSVELPKPPISPLSLSLRSCTMRWYCRQTTCQLPWRYFWHLVSHSDNISPTRLIISHRKIATLHTTQNMCITTSGYIRHLAWSLAALCDAIVIRFLLWKAINSNLLSVQLRNCWSKLRTASAISLACTLASKIGSVVTNIFFIRQMWLYACHSVVRCSTLLGNDNRIIKTIRLRNQSAPTVLPHTHGTIIHISQKSITERFQ